MLLTWVLGNSAQESKDRTMAENILGYIKVNFQDNV